MALSINDEPDLYTPVYNPMRFVIDSTNNAQTNFQYVVDVYTSGVSGYTRLLFPPDPTTGKASPDIQGVLESQITFDLSDTLYGFQKCNNSYKAYEVKFGEQYGPSSGIVTYPNITVTGLKYAWNGVFSPQQFRTFAYTSYVISSDQILSNAPTQQYFTNTSTEHKWMYFLNDTSGTAYFARILTYDENDVLLGTYRIENAQQASSAYTDKLMRIDVGSAGLNGATLYTGSQPVITSSVSYYKVNTENFAGVATSNLYTFTKECQWRGADPISLHWLNRKGGFDSFNFRLVRLIFSDVKRDTMQRNLGAVSASSWTYAAIDRGTLVYNSEIADSIIANSDWINNDQSAWLQELIESPEVYYHDGSELVPVIVKVNKTEIKNTLNEKLFNLQVEVEYANKRWTQRG